ncbi:hypothetical protein [Streptomyces sp. NPDC056154]|uniref:hypothetical protein n=1 Tax=unclassified Streptomyces TaxID=2593676 RepID=UPI0035E28572
MSFIRTTPRQRRLGAAGAAVIIVIVVVATTLTALTPDAVPTQPASILGLLATSSLTGVLVVRLATTGLVNPLLTLMARILASAYPQP